jgi:hypothetical protein
VNIQLRTNGNVLDSDHHLPQIYFSSLHHHQRSIAPHPKHIEAAIADREIE